MIWRDKLGWPVEFVKGKWFSNFIRWLLHTDPRQTWKHRKAPCPKNQELSPAMIELLRASMVESPYIQKLGGDIIIPRQRKP